LAAAVAVKNECRGDLPRAKRLLEGARHQTGSVRKQGEGVSPLPKKGTIVQILGNGAAAARELVEWRGISAVYAEY